MSGTARSRAAAWLASELKEAVVVVGILGYILPLALLAEDALEARGFGIVALVAALGVRTMLNETLRRPSRVAWAVIAFGYVVHVALIVSGVFR